MTPEDMTLLWLSIRGTFGNQVCSVRFLSNVVARKRKLAKFTDSDSIFVGMQYFDVNGNIGELASPNGDDDAIAALIMQQFIPDGIEASSMKEVLRFR
jgi:hypothetical protein